MLLGRFLVRFPKPRSGLLSATKSTIVFQASVKFDNGWEAQLKKEGVVLVDSRNSDELEAKPRVMQAIHVPCRMTDDSDAIMHAAIEKGSLPPDKKIPILVYCAVGGRSARAADALRRLGYMDVMNGGGRDAVEARCSAA
jgi:rhodanese-related sulfurtransferase